jgi:predicted metalloprotease with PDZ domain
MISLGFLSAFATRHRVRFSQGFSRTTLHVRDALLAALMLTGAIETAEDDEESKRIRVLPYDRGSLYLAVVDSRVRAASGGKRSLDNLILAMIARKRGGLAMDQAAWRSALTKELGSSGIYEFDAMLRGDPVLPASSAFGPCFRRTTKMLRRYELGFEPKVLIEPARIVRGLIPGSAAERAGLRNGHHILKPVPQDGIQGDQTAMLHLEILRDGKQFPLDYLPRGETVEAPTNGSAPPEYLKRLAPCLRPSTPCDKIQRGRLPPT